MHETLRWTDLGNPGGGVDSELDRVRFDIADYKSRTDRLRWDDLDFDAFRSHPLDDDTLRVIEYMHDVELHTICYLRDLLVTPAHNDPDVTTFLTLLGLRGALARRGARRGAAAHGRPSGAPGRPCVGGWACATASARSSRRSARRRR